MLEVLNPLRSDCFSKRKAAFAYIPKQTNVNNCKSNAEVARQRLNHPRQNGRVWTSSYCVSRVARIRITLCLRDCVVDLFMQCVRAKLKQSQSHYFLAPPLTDKRVRARINIVSQSLQKVAVK